jgi:hypothetical protein
MYMMRPGLDCSIYGDHIWMKSSKQIPPLSPSKNVLAFLSFVPGVRTNIATLSIYQRLNCFQYIGTVIFDGQENERGDMRPMTSPKPEEKSMSGNVGTHMQIDFLRPVLNIFQPKDPIIIY